MRARRQLFSTLLIVLCPLLAAAQTTGPVTIQPRARPTPERARLSQVQLIRIDTTVVQIPITVQDPLGRFVTGLEKKDFRIF